MLDFVFFASPGHHNPLTFFFWREAPIFYNVMVKKQPNSNLPKVVHDCRELLLWMIPHLDKLPKNRRYTLGEKLENRLLAILESLITAAYARNKSSHLTEANLGLEVARQLWRLCYDFKGVSTKSYEHGGRLMIEIGQQIGGWARVSK